MRACENPYVDDHRPPNGPPTSALFPGYEFDYDAVFAAAARTGTALEIDGQPGRLDLPSGLARRAAAFGCTFALDSDAHDAAELENVSYAVGQARRAWIEPERVLNARPLEAVLAFVAAQRGRAGES